MAPIKTWGGSGGTAIFAVNGCDILSSYNILQLAHNNGKLDLFMRSVN